MKTILRALAGAAFVSATVVAQVITPVWVQHINGLVNVQAADKLPVLVKAGGTGDNTYSFDGSDVVDSYVGFVKYDDDHLLLGIRENGINESDPSLSAELRARAAAYPDRSVIWIDAKTGKPLGLALKTEILPVTLDSPDQSPTHAWWKWGISDGAHGERAIYTGYKYKILRYAPAALVDDANFPNKRATWNVTPTVAWTEPVPNEPNPTIPPYVTGDLLGEWIDSSGGDGSVSWRLKAFRVTGGGNNTKIVAGGATWRASMNEQEFVTADGGLTFYPIARLNDRGDGNGAKGNYSLGGQPSSIRTDPDGMEWCIQGHFPGSGWEARPGRYVKNPNGVNPCDTNDPPVVWWKCTTGGFTSTNATRKYYFDPVQGAVGSPDLPEFSWEAAGLGGWTIDHKVDGVARYDGNWVMTADTKDGVDYIVTYSIPSWNQQFGAVGPDWPNSVDPNSTFKPGWIGLHTLDGKISKGAADGTGNAYKLEVYETDEPILDPNGNAGTGHDYGYEGDLEVYPIPEDQGASLVLWAGGIYGFGVFKVENVAAAITQQPQSATKFEGEALTLSATVTGGANRYQWLKDGAPVPRATAASYAVERLALSDAGTYKLRVLNGRGNVESSDAVLVVKIDDVPPTVQTISGGANPTKTAYWLTLVFSERVTAATAGSLANYSLSGGVAISSVTVNNDTTVTLATGAMGTGDYTLTLNGIKDQSARENVIAANTQIKFKGPALTPGYVLWEMYADITGTLDDFLGNAKYPELPDRHAFLSSFSTIPELGSNVAEQFGGRLTAFVKPTESGDYRFFLRSDDASRLYLSSNADPAGATQIATETACCNAFLEPNPDNPPAQTSEPQALQANVTYYLYADYKEGGGGDYCEVAWRKEGDTTPAASLTAIPGSFLSSYRIIPAEAPRFNAPTLSGGQVTITWTGAGRLQQAADLTSWTDVAGNPTSPYTVPVAAAPVMFYRLVQ